MSRRERLAALDRLVMAAWLETANACALGAAVTATIMQPGAVTGMTLTILFCVYVFVWARRDTAARMLERQIEDS